MHDLAYAGCDVVLCVFVHCLQLGSTLSQAAATCCCCCVRIARVTCSSDLLCLQALPAQAFPDRNCAAAAAKGAPLPDAMLG